ncbi:hypothetical protein ABT369_09170 [Dactylosporangium sp. NPDC000244]|uniref:hypothetical protein n=1 Tax=Dactylosporangium sp. NPDC000244 TaxID=3154365 RepID=UPI003330C86D
MNGVDRNGDGLIDMDLDVTTAMHDLLAAAGEDLAGALRGVSGTLGGPGIGGRGPLGAAFGDTVVKAAGELEAAARQVPPLYSGYADGLRDAVQIYRDGDAAAAGRLTPGA